MDKLTEARKIINSVDAEMAKLFCRRMAAVKDVLEYKREHGLPVLDTARENAVMEANSALIDDEALKEYYISFIRSTMAVSREYQRSLLSGIRAAYCGVEGAFAQIAAKHIYADCEATAYPSFAVHASFPFSTKASNVSLPSSFRFCSTASSYTPFI